MSLAGGGARVPTVEPNAELGPQASQRLGKRDPYRAVFDANPLPLLLCDVGTLRVLAANVAAAELHGASAERLEGGTLFELRRVSDLTSIMLKRAVGRELALGFGFHVRPDGTTFPVQLTVHPTDLGGKPVWLCVLKSLESLLAPREGEQQRRLLEAVGRVAGGVGHDLNNLLSVILSFAGLAASQLSSTSPTQRELAEIRGAAERATHLTRQLLSLSRQGPTSPRPLSLNQVVTRLAHLLRRVLDEGTQLVLDLAEELDLVLADAAHVERLLVQLMAETRGSGQPGTVRIATRNVELEAERGTERHVLLRVTTSDGALTVGVAAMPALVESGNAWLESEAGRGAEFVAYFPSVEGDREKRGAPAKARRETVLVVQENPHLRKTLRNYFAREGFQVLDADSGLEALRLVETCPTIDLLLTDFVLTDGGGGQLGRALRERLPSLRVLVAIGDPGQRAGVSLDERTAVISKPFDLREFGALIEKLLEQPDLT
jgi:PAS domain S-box-containing protein